MNCSLEARTLLGALETTLPVIPKKSVLPVIQCVRLKFDAQMQELTLYGSNLQVEVAGVCIAQGNGYFDVCVNPWDLRGFLKATNGIVHLESENNTLVIRDTGGKFALPTEPGSDFPTIENVSVPIHDNDPILLGEILATCLPFVGGSGESDTRPFLAGVYMGKKGDNAVAIASDAFTSCIYPNRLDLRSGATLTAEFCQAVALACRSTQTCEFGIADDYAKFVSPKVKVVGRHIDAQYPVDLLMQALNSKDTGHYLTFDRQALAASFRKGSIFVDDSKPFARITAGEKMCAIETHRTDTNKSSKQEVPHALKMGSPEPVWLNISILSKALSMIPQTNIVVYPNNVAAKNIPGLICSTSDGDFEPKFMFSQLTTGVV